MLRESRSKNVALIEERIRTYTMNSNMNTTQKMPQPPDPEINFRNHVDNTIDLMNRFSINKLKKKIDRQREMQYRQAIKDKLMDTDRNRESQMN